MNKALARAEHEYRQARAHMWGASNDLTIAMYEHDYRASDYVSRIHAAQEAHREACVAFDAAREAVRKAQDMPLYELQIRDGWAVAPSFRSFFFDDIKDFQEATFEATEEMRAAKREGKLPPRACVTVVFPSGAKADIH